MIAIAPKGVVPPTTPLNSTLDKLTSRVKSLAPSTVLLKVIGLSIVVVVRVLAPTPLNVTASV